MVDTGIFDLDFEDGTSMPAAELQSEDEEEDDTELFDAREMLTPPQNEPSHVTDVIDAMAASISNHSPAMLAAPPNSMEASAADGNLGSGVSPVPPAKVTAKDFDILSVIGQGGYGKVFMVRKNQGPDKDKLYAMKVLKKATIVRNKKDVAHTQAERNILEAVKNTFIVDLFYAFQTNGKLYLILQYIAGGELFSFLDREGMFLENVAIFYVCELIEALEHLHSLGIVYRDLKPENIMLDVDGHVILTDFGLCKEGLGDEKTNTFCGTIEYMAPEILNREGHGQGVDWWSLGALLFDMVTGSPPFCANNRKKTMEKILKANVRFPAFLTDALKDLLRRLLTRDPNKRLQDVGKIKKHTWFRKIKWDIVKQKGYPAPYKPAMVKADDTSNFDARFTDQLAVDSPVDNALSTSVADLFTGFTYVSKSIESEMRKLHVRSSPRTGSVGRGRGLSEVETAGKKPASDEDGGDDFQDASSVGTS